MEAKTICSRIFEKHDGKAIDEAFVWTKDNGRIDQDVFEAIVGLLEYQELKKINFYTNNELSNFFSACIEVDNSYAEKIISAIIKIFNESGINNLNLPKHTELMNKLVINRSLLDLSPIGEKNPFVVQMATLLRIISPGPPGKL